MMKSEKLGFVSVVAIGVGGMVGGGIFAVLGLSVQLAHGGTPVAFLLAGVIALATSYSYARLSVAFPSRGGTVEFLNKAYGTGIITGALNILLSLSYIVMLSLYAYAFGSYAASFFASSARELWQHVFSSGVVVLFTALNIMGARAVGDAEEWIVGLKIVILLVFIAAGMGSVDVDRLQPSAWNHPVELVAGGMIIFLAYEGFELIANTAAETAKPERTLPTAYFCSVGVVILLYILVSTVTVGNLSVDRIVASRDYALAESAKPFLGAAGFSLMACAALLSTASAINATLYGASRISYIIAKDGELPSFLERKIWRRPIEGLLITSAVALCVANFFDISSISIMGSAGFLLVFAMVNGAALRLSRRIGGRRWVFCSGMALCVGALVALVWQTFRTEPMNLLALGALFALAFTIELVYRKSTGRQLRSLS